MYGRKRSEVWNFFEKKTANSALCFLCKKEFKCSNNTTNLIDHLRRKHSTQLQAKRLEGDYKNNEIVDTIVKTYISTTTTTPSICSELLESPQPSTSQQSIGQLTLTGSYSFKELSGAKIARIDKLVASMICKDLQALSIVGDKGFRELVKELEPEYKLPTKRTLGRKLLPSIYEEIKPKIMKSLQETKNVSVTTDIWTDLHAHSYLTLTVHYFLDGILISNVLKTQVLYEGCKSEYLAQVIENILNEWQIMEKVFCIVSDNGVSIKGLFHKLGVLNLPCTAHTLNLVVNKSLNKVPEIKNVLQQCRSLAEYFKSNVVAADKLRSLQAQMGVPELKIKQDVLTRWNSTLIMLERLVQIKEPLSAALVSLPQSPQGSNTEEWMIIEDCMNLLKPFEYVTTELSSENFVSISKVIPLLTGIQHAISGILPQTNAGANLKRCLVGNIQERFSYTEKHISTSVATLLDPRFKKALLSDSAAHIAEEKVLKELTVYSIKNEGEAQQKMEDIKVACSSTLHDKPFWDFYRKKVSDVHMPTTTSSAILFMRQYLELPFLDINSNPTSFWEEHKATMPELRQIAYKYLCVPATSVPSERIFSKAGHIMSEKRNRLSLENIDLLIFLNVNLQ